MQKELYMSMSFIKGRQLLLSAVTCITLAGAPIANAQGASSISHAMSSNTPSQAIIYTFAAAASPASVPPTLSDASCPSNTARPPEGTAKPVDPRLVETINKELTHRLSKKLPVAIAPADATINPGTLVFTGCLTTINGGNAVERMVGFRLGSSHLSAHVRVMLQTKTALTPLQEFDVSVKAGNLLPPLGPAGVVLHGVKEARQTLNADAKKLADQILKKFKNGQKSA
jgi:hypothetical protein